MVAPLSLMILNACASPVDRAPQSLTHRELNRFQLVSPLAVQNATAYTVEKVIIATDHCRVSVTLPPGEEFKMGAKENLLVTAYTASQQAPQEVEIDFVPVKKRPLKMFCQFPKKTADFLEQRVSREFNTSLLSYYVSGPNGSYAAEYKKALELNSPANGKSANSAENRIEK